ncbi:uncharacterized protein LOC122332819 [Puntigrus tetrazona]|uniref:uncharacterized protein LOC122332819 n=1 Tax=Puntigrus tetrazona TaxID=1606681 RepID=UPI001C89FADB|nr:uncharacterized protein LOC122332819 [Puntigrus tetrazona]
MKLLVAVTCWIGIAAALGEDGDDDEGGEIESLAVPVGGNLTISSLLGNRDEDPQLLFFRLRLDSSLELMAQVICFNGACKQKCWGPGVSLISDGGNVTLVLMRVGYNQTGLYKFLKHSKRLENKIYNVTVYQPPLSTTIPEESSAVNRDFTSGKTAVTVCAALVILALVVFIGAAIYRKHTERTHFYEVPQETDLEAQKEAQNQNVVSGTEGRDLCCSRH